MEYYSYIRIDYCTTSSKHNNLPGGVMCDFNSTYSVVIGHFKKTDIMKKRILLSFIIVSLTILTFGQNFGTIGTQWYYSEHAGGMAPPGSEYVHYESVSDTIIDGLTTHKIIRKYYKYNGYTVAFEPLYVYENLDTVFMYNFQKAKFQSVYIFNATQGDTITLDNPESLTWITDSTYRLVIDTVETVIIK